MRTLLALSILTNLGFAQVYHLEHSDKIPECGNNLGKARNFSNPDWDGTSYVRSEITIKGKTYSYIITGQSNAKLALKEGDNFRDLIVFSPRVHRTMIDTCTSLIHISENEKTLKIIAWDREGYAYIEYKKPLNPNVDNPYRKALISNEEHTFWGFDKSVKSLEFIEPNVLKIIKDPTKQYPETELNFEFRLDGVYKNGAPISGGAMDYHTEARKADILKVDPYFYKRAEDQAIKERAEYQARDKLSSQQAPTPIEKAATPNVATAAPVAPAQPIPAQKPVQSIIAKEPIIWPWITAAIALLTSLIAYLYFRKNK